MGGIKKNFKNDVFAAFNKTQSKHSKSNDSGFVSTNTNKRVDKSATHQASKRSGRGS